MKPELITKPGRMEHLLSKLGCTKGALFLRNCKHGGCKEGVVRIDDVKRGLYRSDDVQNNSCGNGGCSNITAI